MPMYKDRHVHTHMSHVIDGKRTMEHPTALSVTPKWEFMFYLIIRNNVKMGCDRLL